MEVANEEGRGIQWIVDNLLNESNDLSRSRSRLIARTETVTASNQAGYFAAGTTGLLYKKEWCAAEDKRTRPDHVEVNGSVVDFEDYFTVGGTKMLLPGAKTQENGQPSLAKECCNCRCVALYLPQRNEQGRLIQHDYGFNPSVLNDVY